MTTSPPASQGFNLIGGEWQQSCAGATFANCNPADLTTQLSSFPQSTPDDVRAAIQAATAALPRWQRLSPTARAEIFHRAWQLFSAREAEIARDLTLENGKTLVESRAEIAAARKEMVFQIGQGLQLGGRTTAAEKPGILAYSQRVPLGVVAVITPWNFPFNVACRKLIPALMAGNCVVFKPASFTPRTGSWIAELLHEAGLPPGVLNFVTGEGSRLGNALLDDPAVQAVSFTGSTDVGRAIQQRAAQTGTRVQAEMGGKNAAVVLADADLDQAADQIVLAAFACAGQWCTSTSRVIAVRDIAEPLRDRILSRTRQVVVGNGLDPATTMGPVAGLSQLETILRYLELGRQEGATLLTGGERLQEAGLDQGTFLPPTIFTNVAPDLRIAQEEIFGPVLSLLTADDFEQAVAFANLVPFGLSSSVFTRNLQAGLSFVEQTDVGLTHVNLPTAYKEVSLEFGGVKDSGIGPPEAGTTGIEFFTKHKVAYIQYAEEE